MNFSDAKDKCSDLISEIERHEALGAIPPTLAEIRETLSELSESEPDDCEACSDATSIARDFSGAIASGSINLAWEHLINLLCETKAYSKMGRSGRVGLAKESQRDLETFVKLAMGNYIEREPK